ncbi:hypothetical protein ACLM5J_05035 [Nocardioides sp. Bht2]|uniref:hypothetical protein n=1 Tax=Nocardioides sp. Bht2 TaxID=3392297 RepID=UPI0039B44EA7
MTEEPEVTRLLRAARAREQMPDDVAARLDSTLAELVAARETETEAGATVTPLRPRRYRTALIAAAAAVIAIGAGGAFLSQLDSSEEDAAQGSTTAESAAVSDTPDSAAAKGPTNRDQRSAPESELDTRTKGYLTSDAGDLLGSTLSMFEPPLTKREQRTIEDAVAKSLNPTADSSNENRALDHLLGLSSCADAAKPLKSDGVVYYTLRQVSDTPRVVEVLTCQDGNERALTSVTLPPRE